MSISDDKQTAIIFDIDNTLIEPADEHEEFGSDQWFCAISNHLILHQIAKNNEEADLLLLPIILKIYSQNKYVLIEQTAAELLNSLQQQGITLLGLTARHPCSVTHTHCHLHSVNIQFHHTYEHAELDLSDQYPACYCNGVLFCDLNDKATVLEYFFNHTKYWPTKIIFIDDKLKNVLKMQEFCKNHEIEYIGIRYSKLDKKVKQFNLENTFGQLFQLFREHPDLMPIPGLTID